LSYRIKNYPGTEVERDELKKPYVSKEYMTVLEYAWSSGVATGKFLEGLREGKIFARKCNRCRRIIVPPRMYCEKCFRATDSWVRIRDEGRGENILSIIRKC